MMVDVDRRLRRLLLIAALTVAGLAGCSSTTKSCSTVAACSTAGHTQFGQAVLTPQGATFVKGSIKNGVLIIEFRDPLGGPAYKEFVGHPKNPAVLCQGTMTTFIAVSPTRRFCYGPTTAALQAELTTDTLTYVLTFTAPPTDAASDQAPVTRIVASLS
jgi:hypothetical protein